jgi:hypothetical protein
MYAQIVIMNGMITYSYSMKMIKIPGRLRLAGVSLCRVWGRGRFTGAPCGSHVF